MYKLAIEHFKKAQDLPYDGVGCKGKISTLVKDGKTEYTIILPANASDCEKFAAGELQAYINQSTGVKLPIEKESERVVLGEKWIGIGRVKIATDLDTTNLNIDGFRIKTEGETLFIKGQRDRGTLYGVYDFLEKFLCVRFLAKDFEYVPTLKEVPLFELDIKEIPAFKIRRHQVSTMRDTAFAAKRRMVSIQLEETPDDAKYDSAFRIDWSDGMHTYKNLIPYEKYYKAHPEWFSEPKISKKGKILWQPVWSNGLKDDGTIDEGMETSLLKEVIKRVKEIILARSEILYVSMGQNDNHNFSNNENCIRQRALFGGYGGQQIVFVNAVAKEIKEWMAKNSIKRELYFVVYAYQETYKSPIKVSDSGELLPFCELAIPRDDVIVQIAPYEASYNEPLRVGNINDFNFIYATEFLGWAKLCKQLFVFDYDVDYSDMLTWYPNTEIIVPNLQYYREIGVTGVMTNGAGGDTHYQAILHTYLFSKLYWNPDLDLDELISEFNRLYFGEHAGYMIDRLIKYIRNHFELVSVEDGYKKPAQIFTGGAQWIVSPTTWNVNFITECERLIEGAQWHTKTRTDYDEKTKEIYLKHLAQLEIMICYAKWKNYDVLYPASDKEKFMEKFREAFKTADVGDFRLSINSAVTTRELLNIKEKE